MKVTVTEDVTVVNVNSEEVYFKVLVKEGDDVLAEKFALEAKASAEAAEDSAISAALSEQVAITQAGIATTQAGIATTKAQEADASATAADISASNALSSEQSANADAIATAADRVQTGLDAIATGADVIATGADRVQTGLDVIATAADRVQTGLDAQATAADRIQTGLDASTATAQAGIATTQAEIATAAAASIVPVTIGSPANGLSVTSGQVLSIGLSSGSANGALSSTDWTTFNAKQNALGFTAENIANKAINLTSPDDTKYPTTLAVSTALAGKQNTLTNPITGTGTSGQVSFFNGATTQAGDDSLFWDNTNKRLGIGTNAPSSILNTEVVNALDSPTFSRTPTFNNVGATALNIRTNYSESPLDTAGPIVSFLLRVNSVDNTLGGFGGGKDGANNSGLISFYTRLNNVQSEKLRIRSNGNVIIQNGGTFTDAGFRLDVNGTARVQGNFTLTGGSNIVLATTTGTRIGTATNQLLSLWNATPNVQPTTAITAGAFVANTSGITDDTATFDGYTMGQVVAALRRIGALA